MTHTLNQTRRVVPAVTLLVIASLACSGLGSPTQAPPTAQVVSATQPPVVSTQTASPTTRSLEATFLGQDGGSNAGQLCESGTTSDNVHIHLSGLKVDPQPTGYSIQDSSGGSWATPCDPVSNWLLYVDSLNVGEADLYFKPFRNAPDNTEYVVTIQYADGTQENVSVIGSQVTVVLSATFLGQDGESFAGQLCTTGTTSDNVHIHLNGLRVDEPVSVRVDDGAGGVWATPCDPVSNWLLYFTSNNSNQADIYFKPFRDAPDNTPYTIVVSYSDDWTQTASVLGWNVKP